MGGTVLAAVTFGELAELVRRRMAGGYEQTEKQEGRRRLLKVVEELAGTDSDDAGELLAGRTWRIAEVRVSGLGGVATLDPAALTLTPTAGVTVVRGPNGHGKTSLARAVDCGLRGERDVPDEIAGELWAADLLTEGADRATVDLSLVSGPAQLAIHAGFARSGRSTVTATLADTEGTRPVDIGESWRRALRGSRACYSFGALQSRLTENRALGSYLEELLVLGPAWEQVRTEVTARADRATRAKNAVDVARRTAVRDESALTARFGSDDRRPDGPPPVIWPQAKDAVDVDAWLRDTGLNGVTAPNPVRVDADHEGRVAALDRAVRDADAALATAERSLEAPGMATALHHIEQIVAIADLADETCPLCGTTVDWRSHATAVLVGLQDRNTAARAVRRAVSDLAGWVDSTLVPLLGAGVPGGPDVEAAAFRQAAMEDGHHAHSAAYARARPLLAAVTSDGYRDWLDRVRATSDATAEWRAALSGVVHVFAGVLREHGPAAAEAGAWKKAQATLDELQVEFRQGRQDSVTTQMHAALRRMLRDADIELTAIRHPGGVKQQRAVQVGLTMGGREATLGMLSSGQRNALLLTPLVILDDTGPFGFLVVDDPVHALDDTRVDLLAQELVRLGRERQVIVLTHDPRLEEHLRARAPAMTVVELSREPVARTVTWTRHTTPWAALLTDARQIYAAAGPDDWAYTEPMESVVAGLCRAAIDGALRQALITRAVCSGDDVERTLALFDRGKETRKRITHVMRLAGGAARLPCLDRGQRDHLDFWNRGAHGQLSADVDLDAAITAAEEACAELDTFDWSAP